MFKLFQNRILVLAVAYALLSLFCKASIFAQEPFLGPTPQHAKLKDMEGKWSFVMKTSDGNESKGTSTMKMECGGLWLASEVQANFAGLPFQGKGLDGYDPAKKKYISVWIDSMTPTPMFFEGEFDNDGKNLTMTCEGKSVEGEPGTFRSVSEFKGKELHRYEMFFKPKDGKEASMMILTYTRL